MLHQQLFHLSTFYRLYRLSEDGQTNGRNMQETIINNDYSSTAHFVAITTVLYRVKVQLSKTKVYTIVCLFVSLGVRGKSRVYCSLLAYCTARFGRSNFGHQMPPRLPTRSAL
jgi:hypothetical protein